MCKITKDDRMKKEKLIKMDGNGEVLWDKQGMLKI